MRKLLLLLLLFLPFVSAENATIKGIVFDRLDNVVGFAEVKLDCLEQTFVADKFGTFSIKDVPPGPCRIYAAFRDGTGFQLITVEPNQTMYIELKLDKTIVNIPGKRNYLLPVILAIAVLLLVLYFVLRKKKVVEEKKIEAKGRVKDILPTLNPKERDVVNFLLANRYKATQAEIRHNTGIPRTSLARSLQSLETKNIVKIVKVGKAVKVHLTDWFLEK